VKKTFSFSGRKHYHYPRCFSTAAAQQQVMGLVAVDPDQIHVGSTFDLLREKLGKKLNFPLLSWEKIAQKKKHLVGPRERV
jgi:hypothetical protein